jgi:hypothetical protein
MYNFHKVEQRALLTWFESGLYKYAVCVPSFRVLSLFRVLGYPSIKISDTNVNYSTGATTECSKVFRKNAFHSLTSSESGASHKGQHMGDHFVEFCHAL